MPEANKNRQFVINIIASLVSCVVSFGISFILNPVIIAEVGSQGSGYLELANQFVSYAAIAATALNSMGGRFITIKLHQKDDQGANEYFNSILYCNFGIVAFLFLPVCLLVLYLEQIIRIDPLLVTDVKLLFAATFANFMVTLISTTFSTATFATNRLDLLNLRTIESHILRAGLLVAAFWLLPVRMYYMGLATLAASVYLLLFYIHYTKTLLPQIHISRSYFSLRRILEILSAGIWNTVMRTGQALTNGLDSLIANEMIGRNEFGYVGTSKTIINNINLLYEAVSAVFTPSLTISFATENKEELLCDLKSAMKITGFFANIPLAFMIAYGLDFYTLWLPFLTSFEVSVIYRLSILAMFGTIVGGAISPLFNVYTVVNKLKWNAFVTLFMGILSTGIVVSVLLVLPDRAQYGPYVVVGTSTLLGIIKNMTFTPMYAASCLGLKKSSFYPVIFRYIAVSMIMIAVFCGVHQVITAKSWALLFVCVALCGIMGALMNFFFLFGQREKALLTDMIAKRIGK